MGIVVMLFHLLAPHSYAFDGTVNVSSVTASTTSFHADLSGWSPAFTNCSVVYTYYYYPQNSTTSFITAEGGSATCTSNSVDSSGLNTPFQDGKYFLRVFDTSSGGTAHIWSSQPYYLTSGSFTEV